MGKQYFREFQHKMFRLHMAVAAVCVAASAFFLVCMDAAFNGAVIDAVEERFGWNAAAWVMSHEEWFVMGLLFLVVFASFFALERYCLGKMNRIFRNIGILFQKDEQFMELDKEFALLEQDLNEQKRENLRSRQLMQLETKRKLDIITYLAHDIKTPLASVIGYLCLLEETENLPEDIRRKYTELTLEKAYRLEKLVNEFFELTRFNIGNIPLEKDSINLLRMMEQLADEFYPMAEKKGCTIETDVPEGMHIYADPDKIARVFNNVLKNALAYGNPDSRIRISAVKEGDGQQICICNEGREIPPEKLERIFEQFYRLDASRSSGTGGAGLGLAIAREIVKEHGGTIDAFSEAGTTTFRVWLPVRGTAAGACSDAMETQVRPRRENTYARAGQTADTETAE